ncbi:hypothetical protein QYE76_008839 [Lolium multiflorum]|uniref:Remorin C-terminal domain-containing protein n=2 Tax=Lolium TaxID=4520 RepID=A0AAD8TU15_LOLMU|nr:hypothetical protein QYE76_008839 [Lolium multiflorum]
MDDGMRQLRVRFSGVGQEDQGGGQTRTMPPQQQGALFGREQLSKGEEYDAAYAATVAAVAYAIAAMEEEKVPSQERKPVPERVASRKKQVPVHVPAAAAPPLDLPPPRRGESMKRPVDGSKISRWFSGKEQLVEDGDDDQRGNVSVRRPVKMPEQKKPEGVAPSGQNVVGKVVDSVPSLERDPRKRSRKFEQEQANQRPAVPEVLNPRASFPRERKESRRYEQETANQMAPPAGRPSGPAYSSDAERMAAAWEKERMTRIKMKYNETMQTIAEWEDEKKAKARRQKEPREGDSESKRAKALQEYNEEMKRINKVATASRLTAEEKKRTAEGKVRQKAAKIRSTGKLPRSCGCF